VGRLRREGRALTEFVYFVRVEAPVDARPIKVGRAQDVAKRVTMLQCSSPWPLTILRTVEATLGMEAALHRFLAEDRLSGEWFSGPHLDSVLALSDEQMRERFARPLSDSLFDDPGAIIRALGAEVEASDRATRDGDLRVAQRGKVLGFSAEQTAEMTCLPREIVDEAFAQ